MNSCRMQKSLRLRRRRDSTNGGTRAVSLLVVSVDHLPVLRVAQVAQRLARDTVLDELHMTIAEHHVNAARMGAKQFIVGTAIVGRPRTLVTTTDRRGVLVDVGTSLVKKQGVPWLARRRPRDAIALVRLGPAIKSATAAGRGFNSITGVGCRV